MDSNSTPAGDGSGKNPKEEEEEKSSFIEWLKSASWKPYYFQEVMINTRRLFSDPCAVYGFHT